MKILSIFLALFLSTSITAKDLSKDSIQGYWVSSCYETSEDVSQKTLEFKSDGSLIQTDLYFSELGCKKNTAYRNEIITGTYKIEKIEPKKILLKIIFTDYKASSLKEYGAYFYTNNEQCDFKKWTIGMTRSSKRR